MLSKIAEFFIFGLTPFMICGIAVPAMLTRDVRLIMGKVDFGAPLILPADATVSVHLVRRRANGGTEFLLAENMIRGGGESPFEFALTTEPGTIEPGRDHVVRAAVKVGGTLSFFGEAPYEASKPETVVFATPVAPLRRASRG